MSAAAARQTGLGYSPDARAVALDRLYGETMGTRWCVALHPGHDSRTLRRLHAQLQGSLDTIVAVLSHWDSHSDLARFNGLPAGTWLPLHDHFLAVMRCALHVHQQSGGAFHPGLAHAVDALGFGPGLWARQATTSVAPDATVAALPVLDLARRALLQPGGVALDLSAIAKGYAADVLAQDLRATGEPAALVEIGGDGFAYGQKPDGSAWRVLVDNPECAADALPLILEPDAQGFATSGDAWRHRMVGTQRIGHTLNPHTLNRHAPNPHTGTAPNGSSGLITVLAPSAMLADAWSTALAVAGPDLGPKRGSELARAAGLVVHGAGFGSEQGSEDASAHAPTEATAHPPSAHPPFAHSH